MDRVLGVIPARYASTRFPGKPLATLGDRSIVEQVWRRAGEAKRIDALKNWMAQRKPRQPPLKGGELHRVQIQAIHRPVGMTL